MVRLITHNLLACHAKGCTTNNFPLQFRDAKIGLREAEFNAEFVRNFLPKIEWKALVDAARQVRNGSCDSKPGIPTSRSSAIPLYRQTCLKCSMTNFCNNCIT